MPRYDFRCEAGHVTEHIFPMADVPAEVPCSRCADDPDALIVEKVDEHRTRYTVPLARRVFESPAAIHFRGPGFYATDVKGALHRRRRRNVGDDLHKEFDTDTARIADAI